ncbi:MAG TPA: NUDIX hydrolase [Nitrososphaerales archaeon]|nr:NUDIX hydrolase [Nitrososphaerales archaeon]
MVGSQDNIPRWTIPKRTRLDNQDLHISTFNLVRKNDDKDTVLFVKAGPKFPVSFKRGKWLLPAAILDFGEKPKDVAKRVLTEQLDNIEYLDPKFLSMQSYFGAHWDIVFIFESQVEEGKPVPTAKASFAGVSFHNLNSLPRNEIAEDHLEVLDELKKGI